MFLWEKHVLLTQVPYSRTNLPAFLNYVVGEASIEASWRSFIMGGSIVVGIMRGSKLKLPFQPLTKARFELCP